MKKKKEYSVLGILLIIVLLIVGSFFVAHKKAVEENNFRPDQARFVFEIDSETPPVTLSGPDQLQSALPVAAAVPERPDPAQKEKTCPVIDAAINDTPAPQPEKLQLIRSGKSGIYYFPKRTRVDEVYLKNVNVPTSRYRLISSGDGIDIFDSNPSDNREFVTVLTKE